MALPTFNTTTSDENFQQGCLQKIRVEFELKNSIMVKFRATSSLKT
jgi:hypothetical protein